MTTTAINGVKLEKFQYVKEIYIDEVGEYLTGLYIFDVDEENEKVLLKEYDGDKGYWVDADEIEVYLDIVQIAKDEGLDYIETTTGMNGYPQRLKFAIVGFDDFAQAEALACKYGLSIESFETKNGWSLWNRGNRTMFGPYQNSASDFGDNYCEESIETVVDLIKDQIGDIDEDNLVSYLKDKSELIEECLNAEVGQTVISNHGEYYETIFDESMSFDNGDGKRYQIGLI